MLFIFYLDFAYLVLRRILNSSEVTMPAGITHVLLAKTLTEKMPNRNENLCALLDEKIKYFQLGALGPDLAYSQAVPVKKWFTKDHKRADLFHYVKTNEIPLTALERIRQINDEDERDNKFSFFLGYMSHTVADGIIHPFVRDMVGDYDDAATEHRELEMKLDVIFLNYLSSKTGEPLNINYTKIQDQLKDIPTEKLAPIAKLFSDLIYDVYGVDVAPGDIIDWVDDLEELFEAAANKNYRWYSWMPGTGSVLYDDMEKLMNEKDKYLILKADMAVNRETTFLSREVHFLNDCVPQFYKVFSGIAKAAYEYVYENGPMLDEEILKPINLDTGRTTADGSRGKNLDSPVLYWEA